MEAFTQWGLIKPNKYQYENYIGQILLWDNIMWSTL